MNKVYPDISHHHPVSDWDQVEQAVGFLITKGTQGTHFVDSTLRTFVTECEKRHIPYWIYTYLNKGDEVEQAKFLVKTCKPMIGSSFVGYALDAEEGNETDDIRDALTWLTTQCSRGMVYVGWSDYAKYKSLVKHLGDNVAWWEARYGRDDGTYNESFPCHDGVDLHQYSSNGICPGIPDKIDVNRLTGTKSLEWFQGKDTAEDEEDAKQTYAGEYPEIPSRGYFAFGDGYIQSPGLRSDVKRLQKLVNWINDGLIKVDGMYGMNTVAAVKLAQTELKVSVDGLFGPKTLMAAKAYRK